MRLNKGQQAAVTAPDGPALVLAGAGSGKTRVIIERLAWLAEERGVHPRHLLAVTFTNKAADEMKHRFIGRVGPEGGAAWIGTFHAFGLYLLRREAEVLGMKRSFTVFDDADQLSLMKRLVRDLPEGCEKVSPREALRSISQFKQRVETPDFAAPAEDNLDRTFRHLWEAYHQTLRRVAAVDFDDLLVRTVALLDEHDAVRRRYASRFRHVLVDEYQDTNRAQYLIARGLSSEHGNLFVVGDEDQSIYSWRGADINNILDFADDFPSASVYRLEQNYRSTKPILDAANALVENNVNRLGKTLWTARQEGAAVRFQHAESDEEEARFVADDMVRRELPPREAAVLYRTNAQSRLVEEALRRKGLHYVVLGGVRFYGRKEVKDVLAYLRLLVNPDDDESVRRVLNVPPRGIGGVSLQRIEEYAAHRGVPLLQTLREVEMDETLSSRARGSAASFVHLIDDLAIEAKTGPVMELVKTLLDRVGYEEYVRKSDEKDFRDRLDIVQEFVSACGQYDQTSGKPLLDFLQDLSLMSDVDTWDPGAPAVTLLTCHLAKGLEFNHVYLLGLEQGLLPLLREFDGDEDIEEERRLCYVAMTRARDSLTLCAARSRRVYGRVHDNRDVSQFVREIGTDRMASAVPEKRRRPRKAPPKRYEPPAALTTGTRVRHAKFGNGYVMYTRGAGEKMRARIRFDTGRTALLMVKQAPLEILERKKR